MQNNVSGRRDRSDTKATAITGDSLTGSVEEVRGHRIETDPVDDAAPIEVKETLSEATDAEKKEPVFGVVTDCLKLNVRKEPKTNADILTVITALSKVQVDIGGSTDEFYKVCTETGIEGFCMKKYVALPR